MNRFIPYEKLSKKEKRLRNAKARGDFGSVRPDTRRKESAKIYNRKKARHDWRGPAGALFLCRARGRRQGREKPPGHRPGVLVEADYSRRLWARSFSKKSGSAW